MKSKSLNSYLKDAWTDLSSDETWWRAILVLGLLNCVPLVGTVFSCGYLYDWAKEAAWGMRSSISHAVGDIGRRGKYGLMVFGVVIIWVAPVLIVAQLMRFIPVVGQVLCFLVEILAIIVAVLAAAAALRSIIYERVAPGLQVGRVLGMVRRDPNGLGQAFAIALLYVVLLVAVLFVLLLPAVPFVGAIMASSPEAILGANLPIIVMLGMLTVVVAIVVWVSSSICAILIFALFVRALGYWMAQFEPAKWRSPADPMPFEIELAAQKKAKAEEKARAKAEKKAKKKAGKQVEGEDQYETEAKADAEPTESESAIKEPLEAPAAVEDSTASTAVTEELPKAVPAAESEASSAVTEKLPNIPPLTADPTASSAVTEELPTCHPERSEGSHQSQDMPDDGGFPAQPQDDADEMPQESSQSQDKE